MKQNKFHKNKRRWQAALNIAYKVAYGFGFGAGITGLFFLFTTTGMLPVLIGLSLLFACLYGIKEAIANYQRYQLEQALQNHQPHKISPKIQLIYQAIKRSVKPISTTFGVVAVSVLFVEAHPALLLALSAPTLMLIAGTATAVVLLLAHAVESALLKARLKNIHTALSSFDMSPNTFTATTPREQFIYGLIYPMLAGFQNALNTTSAAFGILVLLTFDFGIPIITLSVPTVLLLALIIGLVSGILSSRYCYDENQLRLQFIDYVHDEYHLHHDKQRIASFCEFKARLKQQDSTGAADIGEKMGALICAMQGAGVGTSFVIAGITLLAEASIFINPMFTVGLVFCFATTFAAMNVYRLQLVKPEQRNTTYETINIIRRQPKSVVIAPVSDPHHIDNEFHLQLNR
jgi:hypothetical protein